jgi:GNAT superfamily N-acetyltransferase
MAQWQRGEYTLDTDRERLPLDTIVGWLAEQYWHSTRSPEQIRRSWDPPVLGFCVYEGDTPIGCARVVSDFVTVAYLADVLILPAWRGKGLGLWAMQSLLEHPDLQTVEWLLFTRDAHGLYEQIGYERVGPRIMRRPPTTPSIR